MVICVVLIQGRQPRSKTFNPIISQHGRFPATSTSTDFYPPNIGAFNVENWGWILAAIRFCPKSHARHLCRLGMFRLNHMGAKVQLSDVSRPSMPTIQGAGMEARELGDRRLQWVRLKRRREIQSSKRWLMSFSPNICSWRNKVEFENYVSNPWLDKFQSCLSSSHHRVFQWS